MKRFTPEKLNERLAKNHSLAARNPELASGGPGAGAVVERPALDGPLAAREAQAPNPDRFLIRVKSFRQRLLDTDNCAIKYFVDCLRFASIISDDSPAVAEIQASQEKVSRKEDQRTEITIEKLTP